MNDETLHDFWEEDADPRPEEATRAEADRITQQAVDILNTETGVKLGEKLIAMQAKQHLEALFLRTRRTLIQKEALTQWFKNEVTREWFHEQVWPVIKRLAADDQHLSETGEIILHAVFRLTERDNRELGMSTINEFLSVEYPSLYERYGANVANAVANDLRLGSDAWTSETADETWKPLKEKLSQRQLDAIAKAFTYRTKSKETQQTFLKRIPRVLDAVAAENDPDMMEDFLWILEDGAGGDQRGIMPVLDPEKMVKELRALRFRKQEAVYTMEELMDPDKKLLSSPSKKRRAHLLGLLTIAIDLYPDNTVTLLNDGSPNPNVGNISNTIIGVQQAVDTQEEVDELLRIALFNCPRPDLLHIVTLAKPIKDFFPSLNGKPPFESFVLYMKEIYEHNPLNDACMKTLIQRFGNPESHFLWPEKNRDTYMEVGLGVVKYLREYATPYFNWLNLNFRLHNLLKEDPAGFAEAMEGAKTCAFQFMVLPYATPRRKPSLDKEWDDRYGGDVTETVLTLYLRFWGDPQFDDILRGLDVLRHTINQILEDTPQGKETALLMAHFRNVVNAYAELVVVMAEKTEKRTLEERDYKADAQRMALRMMVHGAANFFVPEEFFHYVVPLMRGKGPINTARKMILGEGGTWKFMKNLDLTLSVARALRRGTVLPHALEHNDPAVYALALRNSLEGPGVLDPAPPPIVQTEDCTARHIELRESPQTVLIRFVQHEVREAVRTAFWRHAMGFDGKGNLDMPPTDVEAEAWLSQANSATRFAASTAGLFAALGLHEVIPNFYELPRYLPTNDTEPLATDDELEALREQNGFRINDILERLEVDQQSDVIRQRIRALLPHIARWIRAERMKLPGLMAVGLKVQTHKEVSAPDLRFVLDLGQMGNIRTSPFQLKHAKKSLVLPPLPSTLELKWLAMLFYMFGVTDDKKPQLHLTGGGRWPSHVANMVGASLLLASPTDLEYVKGAFASQGHDFYSDAHLMVYDAGVRNNTLPFDLLKAHGRTDIQGRHDLDDLDWWQLISTAANHHVFEGPFQRLWAAYKMDFLEKLVQTEGLLLWFLHATWCHDWKDPKDALEQHEEMIAAFLKARQGTPEIVDHVQGLVRTHILNPLLERRPEIVHRYPEQIRALQTF